MDSLEPAVCISFDDQTKTGVLLCRDLKLRFAYKNGQTLRIDDQPAAPRLSGNHEQPDGYQLKLPTPGDALLVQIQNDTVVAWAYMSHFSDMSERIAKRASH